MKRIVSILLLLCLAGCTSRYQPQALKGIKKNQADFSEKREDIELRVNQLNNKQLGKLFKSSLSDRHLKGFLLTVKNNSDQKIYLDYQNIGLSLISTHDLYQNLSKYSSVRLGLAVGGTTLLALAAAGLCTIPFPLMTGALAATGFCVLLGCAVATPIVFIGGTFTGIDAAVFNQKLKKELKHKIVTQITIKPGKKYSAICATRDSSRSFDVSLLKGKETQEKVTFNVIMKDAK